MDLPNNAALSALQKVHEINQGRRYFGDCFDYIRLSIERECSRNWCNFHTQPILPEEKLVVTLRFLITGASYKSLSLAFRIGASTISNIVRETMDSIWNVLCPIHMPIPTKTQFIKIAEQFYQKRSFPHCLGALDAKHIRIKCPPHSGSVYYNYKKFYSVVLQAVVDADYKFIIIDVGGYGQQHDSSTFRASSLYRGLKSKKLKIPEDTELPGSTVILPFVFIADGAYPLMKHIIKPYPGHNLPREKIIFNKKLSAARMVVECAFGQLAKKFSIFNKTIEQSPKFVNNIVKCACLLHNIILEKCNIIESEREEPSSASKIDNIKENTEAIEALGSEVRQEFMQYFVHKIC
ncbi:uncharacterized protein LOC106640929 [Copidosoma floridanum]|uniref:uncharacterized protein LOC106640929 n=1 Tax=Copidosoma floridanum TaxID=29053 RepID=UPI0006C93C55|nr:uncharacterized protein LOC106640929 [Copidosoma floridanum]